MSPEVPAIIVLKGLEDAGLGINDNFNLHDADRSSWKIEHSRSFTRQDIGSGDSDPPPVESSRFQQQAWDVALRVLKGCGGGFVTTDCLGRARAARVLDGSKVSTANYDRAAAGHGAVESARLLLMLGSAEGAQLNFIRSVLEQEKLPRDLGWEPQEYSGRIDVMLDVAARSQAPDKMLRCASNGRVATRLVRHTAARETTPLTKDDRTLSSCSSRALLTLQNESRLCSGIPALMTRRPSSRPWTGSTGRRNRTRRTRSRPSAIPTRSRKSTNQTLTGTTGTRRGTRVPSRKRVQMLNATTKRTRKRTLTNGTTLMRTTRKRTVIPTTNLTNKTTLMSSCYTFLELLRPLQLVSGIAIQQGF